VSDVWVDPDSLLGLSADGVYEFVMDGRPACDVRIEERKIVCRLPAGHEGDDHLWFSEELASATGVRVKDA
jgi:hypothetical protein